MVIGSTLPRHAAGHAKRPAMHAKLTYVIERKPPPACS
jgi:hypothetical protein